MIALARLKRSKIRSGVFFELGAGLGVSGSLILMMFYYGVPNGPIPAPGSILAWLVPAGMGCCLLGAVSLSAGLASRIGQGVSGKRPIVGARPGVAGRGNRLLRSGSGKNGDSDLTWTQPLLRSLDWKVFRDLAAAYFRAVGFQAVVDKPGRPNGVDFWLYQANGDKTDVAVRCMPWGTERVDERQVRDFHRVMQFIGVEQGVILTTGVFSEAAFEVASDKRLELIGGEDFVARLSALPEDISGELLHEAALSERIREEGKTTKAKRKKKVEKNEKRRWFGF